jgi:hypothetical protein
MMKWAGTHYAGKTGIPRESSKFENKVKTKDTGPRDSTENNLTQRYCRNSTDGESGDDVG